MKVLFIGGTGILSSASATLAIEKGLDLTLLNRGKSIRPTPAQAKIIQADINDANAVRSVLEDQTFDVVVDFIAYTQQHVQRDLDIFSGKIGQYVFISSASAYQTPPSNIPFRESTPLENPFWEYSRNKIACEEKLLQEYRANKFPFTIIRPSHTYDKYAVPVEGGTTVLTRMMQGKPILVHGDGTSIWTLTHNTDFAKGLVGLLGNSRAIAETFHITSDEWVSWNHIYKALGKALGVDPQLVHVPSELIAAYDFEIGSSLLGDKAHSAIFDNSKIKQVVPEFCATVPFAQGVREIADWFLSDPANQTSEPGFDSLCDQIITNYLKAWPE
jgi:nucleoside-diphosphate-sugar epimerase